MKDPEKIEISWEAANLTTNFAASLTISLYGYKETTIRPQLMFIDVLEVINQTLQTKIIFNTNSRWVSKTTDNT